MDSQSPAFVSSNTPSASAISARLLMYSSELRHVFTTIDKDQDGNLSKKDLLLFLETLNLKPLTDEDMDSFICRIKGVGAIGKVAGEAGVVDFPTFLSFMDQQLRTSLEKQLVEIFLVLDDDKDGIVTTKDLHRLADSVKIPLSPEGANELLMVQGNLSGKTNYAGFCNIIDMTLPT